MFQGYDILRSEVPQNISRVSEIGTRLIPITFPLFSCTSVFGTLASLPNLYRFLNNVSEFQYNFMQTFTFHRLQNDPFRNLRVYCKRTFIFFRIASAIAILTVLFIVENFWGTSGNVFPPAGLPRVTATFTMLIMVGGHGIHFLMYRTLRESFTQIRFGIDEWINNCNPGDELYLKSLKESTKQWARIVVLAKAQVQYAGKAVALHHVSTTFVNFAYLCLGVFSCLSSRLAVTEGNRGYTLLLFCVWGFTLLTVKAFMCEHIIEQVKYLHDN